MKTNKHDLIRTAANASGQTQRATQAAVDAFLQALTESLSAGETVHIRELGTFEIKPARTYTKSNLPGCEMPEPITGRHRVLFRASQGLKDNIN